MKKKLKSPNIKKARKRRSISADICLIVHGTALLHAKQQDLVAQPDESVLKLTPRELAEAAQRLLPLTSSQQRIALALPANEFVATSLNLPAIAAQNVRNAVSLQLPTLLPGITEPLLLAVQAPSESQQTCALWMPLKRAEELWKAFEQVGLFLNYILPRPLVLLPPNPTSCVIYDEDELSITCVEWSAYAIQRWLHVPRMDCDSSDFQNQLNTVLSSFKNDIHQERKNQVEDWQDLPMPASTAYDYAFIPPGATLRMTQAARKTKRRRLAALFGLFVLGIAISIYFAFRHEQNLQHRLAELKNRTVNISHLRAEVGEIEESVGLVKNFPRQDVVYILEALNRLIPKDSWIVNFSIEGGNVKLEGYSPNPTQLIEILSKESSFYNVEQSRGTTRERGKTALRFGISFKLRNFDLAAYWLEYFPNKR